MTTAEAMRVAEQDDRAVATYLEEWFHHRRARSARFGEAYVRLWESAQDAAGGGKRLRPALVVLAYRHLARHAGAAAEPLPGAVVELAAAFELLHTSFVVHDDVVDHDLVRRGRPNVAGRAIVEAIDGGASREQAADYGQAAAILVGDLLLSAAHVLVAGLRTGADRRRALLDLFDDAVFRTAAGEHADVRASVEGRRDEHTVLAVVENKTAAYSFAAPLQAGAVLAGAGPAVLAGLGRVGSHLGIAFQLRDDVLGAFGDEQVTGKSSMGDLREGKETLLVAYARRDPSWAAVDRMFGRPDLDEHSAQRLRETIRGCGALARVERRILAEVEATEEEVRALDVPEGLREAIIETARCVVGRQR